MTVSYYIHKMESEGYTVLALQMSEELVGQLGRDRDPYRWLLLGNKYLVFITGNDKGHYFSLFAKKDTKIVELIVSHKEDWIRHNYKILGDT